MTYSRYLHDVFTAKSMTETMRFWSSQYCVVLMVGPQVLLIQTATIYLRCSTRATARTLRIACAGSRYEPAR